MTDTLVVPPIPAMAHVTIMSFPTKYPNPPIMRYELDASKFRDPIGQAHLKHLNGRSQVVQEFVAQDQRVSAFIDEMCAVIYATLRYGGETYVSIGVHDTHGTFISPAIVEMLAGALRAEGVTQVHVSHLGLQ